MRSWMHCRFYIFKNPQENLYFWSTTMHWVSRLCISYSQSLAHKTNLISFTRELVRNANSLILQSYWLKFGSEWGGGGPICLNKPSGLFCRALYFENHWLWDKLQFLPGNLPFLEKNGIRSLFNDGLSCNASQPTEVLHPTAFSCGPYNSASREVLIFQLSSERYRLVQEGPTSTLDLKTRASFPPYCPA